MSRSKVTSEFRKLLDESGTKYEPNGEETLVRLDGKTYRIWAYDNERLVMSIAYLTPEQVISATLGSDEPPYDELLRCLENDWHISASWDGLRKFWNIELTEEGVRMRDAELGSGTCELVETDSYSNPHEFVHVLECSACGETCEHVNGSYPRCPHCGAKVVER